MVNASASPTLVTNEIDCPLIRAVYSLGACCGAKNTHKANKKRAVYTMPRAGASAKRHGRGRAGDDSGVC
jgi:hypothetical protein